MAEGQNLNFAIPIDYAWGLLDSRQTHPLESIYEPEEAKKAAESDKPPAEVLSGTADRLAVKRAN